MLLGKPVDAFGRHYAGMLDVAGYDRRGPAMMAISALDMALHDASARIRGQSVADMPTRRARSSDTRRVSAQAACDCFADSRLPS